MDSAKIEFRTMNRKRAVLYELHAENGYDDSMSEYPE